MTVTFDAVQYKKDITKLLENLILGLEISTDYKCELSNYADRKGKMDKYQWIFKLIKKDSAFRYKVVSIEYILVDDKITAKFHFGPFSNLAIEPYACEVLFEYSIEVDHKRNEVTVHLYDKEDVVRLIAGLLQYVS